MKIMKKGNFLVLGLLGLVMVPSVVYGISSLTGLIEFLTNSIIMPIIGLIGALAVLFFLWGVMKFIKDADNETKRAEGRQFILYGIIGLFVMVSVYGLVRVLENTFQLPVTNNSTRNTNVVNTTAPGATYNNRNAQME